MPPLLTDLPPGCSFGPRCPLVGSDCQVRPLLEPGVDGHAVTCHRVEPAR